MPSKPEKFLIRNHGPNTKCVTLAMNLAVSYVRQNRLHRILLLVPTKESATTTIVGTTLGVELVKSLLIQERTLDGIQFSLESVASYSRNPNSDVVIGFHVAKEGVDKVVDSEQLSAFFFVPWTSAAGDAFEKTWQPTVYDSDGSPAIAAPPHSLPEALKSELERLTQSVNLSTGIAHPCDKEAAQDMFKLLKKRGIVIIPEAIRAWAVTHGWQSEDADDLAKLAARYVK